MTTPISKTIHHFASMYPEAVFAVSRSRDLHTLLIQGRPKYLEQFFVCRNFIKIKYQPIFKIVLLSESGVPPLKIPPHLKCVATLPCVMTLSGANCCSVSLITPLVSGVAGLNASSSSNMETLNIWCNKKLCYGRGTSRRACHYRVALFAWSYV